MKEKVQELLELIPFVKGVGSDTKAYCALAVGVPLAALFGWVKITSDVGVALVGITAGAAVAAAIACAIRDHWFRGAAVYKHNKKLKEEVEKKNGA